MSGKKVFSLHVIWKEQQKKLRKPTCTNDSWHCQIIWVSESWRYQAFMPAAFRHSVEIFPSSHLAKKKDTGASSYKVDSNMGILGFFGDIRFLSTKHIISKCSKEHASAHLDKIMNHWRCPSINSVLAVTKLSETKIYIHFIIQYPLHIVLHSGFEFLKLQFFFAIPTIKTHSLCVRLKMASQRPVWVTACALREWQCLRCDKAQAIHRETQT